jgi:F-type H+-transporting ATPase subunit b
VITRTKHLLALTILALLTVPIQPQSSLAAQDAPRQREGTAAQPEPQDRGGEATTREATKKEGAKSDADEIRNAPAVRKLAQWTGLSVEKAYWLSVFLNFAILAVLLGMLLKKVLPATFKARNESIQKRIEEARKTSEEARERLKQVEARLSRLDVEISAMRREAEENARNEENRVLAEGEAERRRIVSSAEQEIAAVAGNARRELKAYAAELAVSLAGKKIKVGKEIDQSLVHEFTVELGKDGN